MKKCKELLINNFNLSLSISLLSVSAIIFFFSSLQLVSLIILIFLLLIIFYFVKKSYSKKDGINNDKVNSTNDNIINEVKIVI